MESIHRSKAWEELLEQIQKQLLPEIELGLWHLTALPAINHGRLILKVNEKKS